MQLIYTAEHLQVLSPCAPPPTPTPLWKVEVHVPVLGIWLRRLRRGFKYYSGHSCLTTLGKLIIPVCLCHQAV